MEIIKAFALPGPTELIIIGCILFLLFGGKMMKSFFKNITAAIQESKKAVKELQKPIEEIKDE